MTCARQQSAAFYFALGGGQIAVVLGLVAMVTYGAPQAFVAINAMSLVLATILALLIRRWGSGAIDRWIAGATLVVLLATLLVGPELGSGPDPDAGGVRRWLSAGPIRLHIGLLLIPAFAVAVTRIDARQATGALCLAAMIAAVQPDFATALAVLAIAMVTATSSGNPIRWVAVTAAAASVLWCLRNPDNLAPVRFVEHVLVDVAAVNFPLAVAMAAASLAAIAGPLLGWAQADPSSRSARAALAASLAAFLFASFIGHYPTPLLGAGAAAILGWGLGLGRLFAPVGTSPFSG